MDEIGAGIVSRGSPGHARVARALGTGIVAGRFPEGAVLPGEAVLLSRFGVSRTVLREAIKTLSGKGMLEARTRVGTRVRERAAWNLFDRDVLAWYREGGIDGRFLRDLAEIRLAIEPRAAALAAERRSDGDVAAMRMAMAQMEREPSTSVAFADADLALHIAVANASGNPFMRSIGAVIEAALRASFVLSAPVETADRDTVLVWHQRIIDAIADGNPEAASEAMIEVIYNGRRRHAQSAARTDQQ